MTDFQSVEFVIYVLENYDEISEIFEKEMFDEVIHLAAQVGVRSPPNDFHNYISSNLIAFSNILDLCRVHKIKHLVYASSSFTNNLPGPMDAIFVYKINEDYFP